MLKRKDLYNIPGWHTHRHLIVIESDDWGSIRTPSYEAYNNLLNKGIRVDRDPYCRYDNLATANDLSNLFEVLSSVKDSKGHPAIITANTVTCNPVFEKIKADKFNKYHYELFTDTLKRSQAHYKAFDLWQQGIHSGLFYPQLHGREHLNVKKWLKALRNGEPATIAAFNIGSFGLTQIAAPSINEYYMGAFNSILPEDIQYYSQLIDQACNYFEQLFGYRSDSFIATTYEWSPLIEPFLFRNGIRYLQGTICQKIPIGDDQGFTMYRRCFQGRRNKNGLTYLLRNCFFEPSTQPNRDWVDECLHHIATAYKWSKAANICSHRVNYIGSIDKTNTDRNLPLLKQLLHKIVENWPDCEFITSSQLGHIIRYHD